MDEKELSPEAESAPEETAPAVDETDAPDTSEAAGENTEAPCEPSEEELSDISDDMLRDAYNTLSQFAAMMDYEDAVFVLNELKQYRVSGEEKDRLERIHVAVEALDWDTVNACLAEL